MSKNGLETLSELYAKKERACQKGMQDPSINDCHECSFTNYGHNCYNLKLPQKTEFTSFMSGLSDWNK